MYKSGVHPPYPPQSATVYEPTQYPTTPPLSYALSTIESLQRVKIDVSTSSPYTRIRCHSCATLLQQIMGLRLLTVRKFTMRILLFLAAVLMVTAILQDQNEGLTRARRRRQSQSTGSYKTQCIAILYNICALHFLTEM